MVRSLFLATSGTFLFTLARDDLPEHDDTVSVHEGDTREAFTIFESVAHQRLLRLEAALGHLIRLQCMRVLHLLATCLLAHLPLQLGDAACGSATTHETDRRIAHLDLIRDVEHLNLGIELPGLSQS